MKSMRSFACWISLGLILPGLASAQLVISELMYNPPGGYVPNSTNTVDGDDYEFVEIFNTGAPVDLNGVSFTDGISYTFTGSLILGSNQRLVVVNNRTRFLERYPGTANVAPGSYSGKLSNGGEKIELSAAGGAVLVSFSYGDDEPWTTRADGSGSSLVFTGGGDANDPANWRASTELYGSPADAPAPAQSDIVINEVLAHTDPPQEDAVEFFNSGASPVPLYGWALSDDLRDPFKYEFTNATIPPGGYYVLYEYQFNTNALFDTNNTPFAISSFGDSLYLTAPMGGGATRLVDHVDFGATPNGFSIGRYPNATGSHTLLRELTLGVTNATTVEIFRTGPGEPNSGPFDTPVIINEIMYHSDREESSPYEYVELLNVSTQSVDLTDWRLGGAGFTIPTGTVVAAGDYIVCCASQELISATYSIANVVGNWTGRLDHAGERLELRDTDGAVMDSVRFNDQLPWPTGPDGYGPALERINPFGISDDYANWAASFDDTNWADVVWTQQVNSSSADLRLWLDAPGMAWIDDLSVQRVGIAAELLVDGGFEAAFGSGWVTDGNHSWSRIEVAQGYGGSRALALAGTFSRVVTPYALNPVAIFHGGSGSNHVRSVAFPTVAGQQYRVSARVRRGRRWPKLFMWMDGQEREILSSSRGSPGMPNQTGPASDGLVIDEVGISTNPITTAGPPTITAEVRAASSVDRVDLRYRSFDANGYEFTDMIYTTLSMKDDGVAPDALAGDGTYTVQMPATFSNRSIVRYHVRARDLGGYEALAPRRNSATPDFAYWVENAVVQTNIPNWQLFTDGNDVQQPVAQWACAVATDGQVFLDFHVRHRGNAVGHDPFRTGLALRFNRDNRYDAWYGKNQDGVNFRHRKNTSPYYFRRVVNEYLGYHLQELVGMTTPFNRHICAWIDGDATVTVELESPQSGFLDLHDHDNDDFISRGGYTGLRRVDGDEALNNFWTTQWLLETAAPTQRVDYLREMIDYNSVRYCMGMLSLTANGDQHSSWNMFQHRRVDNLRWRQYPWDVDNGFVDETVIGTVMTELHPYYQTPDHPNIWDAGSSRPLGAVMFYPESGPDAYLTEPVRHRHQLTLWRYYHTIFTPEYLFPLLDELENRLRPVYQQVAYSDQYFTNQLANARSFIEKRRDFYLNGSWSDKMTSIWNSNNVYSATNVYVSEIMVSPQTGGEYIELVNMGPFDVDLSWWELVIEQEHYRLPHGTVLASGDYLAISDDVVALTNTYLELSAPGAIVHRYTAVPIWDAADVWESVADYQSRLVEIPGLTLPNHGSTITLSNLRGQTVESVSYEVGGSWPTNTALSLERIDPASPATDATAWQSSALTGTPAMVNAATLDQDGDGMMDPWEQTIVDASGGSLLTVADVHGGDDFDGDGVSNWREFILGSDPTVQDASILALQIQPQGTNIVVTLPTIEASGPVYVLYNGRYYDLAGAGNINGASTWLGVPNATNHLGTGAPLVHTNQAADGQNFYRARVRLVPLR